MPGTALELRPVKALWRDEVTEGASHWIPPDAPGQLHALLLDWLS
jgi:hypothetical protein